jgi:hypothetical protein
MCRSGFQRDLVVTLHTAAAECTFTFNVTAQHYNVTSFSCAIYFPASLLLFQSIISRLVLHTQQQQHQQHFLFIVRLLPADSSVSRPLARRERGTLHHNTQPCFSQQLSRIYARVAQLFTNILQFTSFSSTTILYATNNSHLNPSNIWWDYLGRRTSYPQANGKCSMQYVHTFILLRTLLNIFMDFKIMFLYQQTCHISPVKQIP